MEASRRAEFFRNLQEQIRESHIETNLVPPGDDGLGETLRAMLPVTDEGDPNLLEIMAVPYVEDADMLIFYTTMIAKIGPGYEDMVRAIPQWNHACPLGGYCIYDNQGLKQFVHKYSLLFDPEIEPDELADTAMFHLMLLYDVVSQKFKEARAVSRGGAS